MASINELVEALEAAKEAAKSVVDTGYSVEAATGALPLHIGKGISADTLQPDEQEALAVVIGDIIDTWQELNPSIAKNWRKSVPALMLGAMILKGITGSNFGDTISEEASANLMATEIRPADLGKTDWSISTTAGNTVDLIGTATAKLVLSQTTGERKVVCIIRNGFLTIDTPVPFDEVQVIYDSATYLPYAFGAEGEVPAGQSENKLNYTARLRPIIIQPGDGIYVRALANATVTTNLMALGMTFYEKQAFATL